MNAEELKKIIRMLDESNINELELAEKDFTLRLSKNTQGAAGGNNTYSESMPSPAKEKAVPAGEKEVEEETAAEGLVFIESPIVGTFYEASAPGERPFVQKGDRVKKGQVVCIIEAMKLMNEIKSEVDGIVEEILVVNEQMVEYGHRLMAIRPEEA